MTLSNRLFDEIKIDDVARARLVSCALAVPHDRWRSGAAAQEAGA